MSDFTATPNYGLLKPTPNADEDQWGIHLNSNFDTLDGVLQSHSGSFLPIAGGTMTGPLNFASANNYLQYTTTGTSRLRYMVGAVERLTLPDTKPVVTGSRGGNAALASLLTALAAANLITDSTSV